MPRDPDKGDQTYVLSALSRRVSTVQRDQVMLEEILSISNVLGDGDVSPAALQHNLVLYPQSLAPGLVVDPALDGRLGGIESVLLDLEPLRVARVEGGAGAVAAGEVHDGGAFGVGPLSASGTLVASPADVHDLASLNGSGDRASVVSSGRARDIPNSNCEQKQRR